MSIYLSQKPARLPSQRSDLQAHQIEISNGRTTRDRDNAVVCVFPAGITTLGITIGAVI